MPITCSEFDAALEHALKNAKVTFGAKRVMDYARRGTISLIVIANNAPEHIKKSIRHVAKLSDISVVFYPDNSQNLGRKCGKPFGVSALGIERTAKRLKIIDLVRHHAEREIYIEQ
ncbi:MAG: 50S ribosomal protein L30e [Candidatus Korarchaeota archaeon]